MDFFHFNIGPKPRILLYGGGQNAVEFVKQHRLRAITSSEGAFTIAGFIDDGTSRDVEKYGVPYLGTKEDLRGLRDSYGLAVCTASVAPDIRKNMFDVLDSYKFTLPSVSPRLGFDQTEHMLLEGAIVAPGSIFIGDGQYVGRGALVAPGATIEGLVRIDDYSIVLPGAFVGPAVTIGKFCCVGPNVVLKSGSVVSPGTSIEVPSSIINESVS
jgi:hypothetical protein